MQLKNKETKSFLTHLNPHIFLLIHIHNRQYWWVVFLLLFLTCTVLLALLSHGCEAMCILINVLVLWSICLSSSVALFKIGPDYLSMGIYQVFIPLIKFHGSFVTRHFLVRQCTYRFPSLLAFRFFSDFAVLFLLLFSFSTFYITFFLCLNPFL